MLNCAIYPRKSKQVDNSDSMDAQINMCIRYLDDKYGKGNYNVKIYDGDYGITGHSTKNRKDFQRMMKDISEKKIELVLIQRYDRIARNTRDFCNLYHDMEINGCNLVSVSQQIDTTTPYGKNFMYMQASMAELEWALNSERRKDAIKYANSIGKCTLANQSIPMGYKAEYIDGTRRLVKDKEAEPIIIDMFEHFGKYRNYCACAKYLNDKYGLLLSNNTIKRCIRNELYCGIYRGNPCYCEPYLTKEEWDSMQIYKPLIRNDERKRTEILFSGMIRCPHCNRLMRACQKTKRDNVFRYYHCEYHSSKTCDYRRVKSERLIEEMLIKRINEYLNNQTVSIAEQSEKKKNFESLVKKYEQELGRLNMMFLKGRIDEKTYDTEYLRLTDLIAQNKANTQAQDHSENFQGIFVENWEEMYRDLNKLNQKIFWREVIKQIIVDEDMNVVDVVFL